MSLTLKVAPKNPLMVGVNNDKESESTPNVPIDVDTPLQAEGSQKLPENPPLSSVHKEGKPKDKTVLTVAEETIRGQGKEVLKPVVSAITNKPLLLENAGLTVKILRRANGQPAIPFTVAEFRVKFPILSQSFIKKINEEYGWNKEEIEKFSYYIPARGVTLNLEEEHGFFVSSLLRMKDSNGQSVYSQIGDTKNPINRREMFYRFSELKAANDVITKSQRRHKAFTEFYKFSSTEIVKMVALYGYETKYVSFEVATQKLIEEIEKDPDKFIAYCADTIGMNDEILFNQAIEFRHITKSINAYYFQEIFLGNDIKESLFLLNKPASQALKNQIRSLVEKSFIS